MHPHANPRRLTVLLTIVLAACAPGGSPGPSTSGSPSTVPGTAGPSGAASPDPSAAAVTLPVCTDPYAQPFRPLVQIPMVSGETTAFVRHVVATSTGSLGFVVSLPERTGPAADDIGIVVGNRGLPLTFIDDPDGESTLPIVVTGAQATLRTGTAVAVPVVVALGSGDPRLLVPDLSANVAISMTLEWTDGCWTYRGDVQTTAQIVLAATVAACPATDPGMRAAAEAIRHIPIQLGPVQQLLTNENWTARFADFSGDQQLAQFQGADFVRAPFKVPAGTSFRVFEASTDLTLGAIQMWAYPLDQVLPDPENANLDPAFDAEGIALPDGSVSIPVPTTRGTYLLDLYTQFTASCLDGYGHQWVTIQTT